MSSRKREFYSRCGVQLRTHDRPSRAEKACPGAMSLYLFLLLQARGEESDGEVSELVAMAAWSAPIAYRRKQLDALIAAGLVERGEEGWLVVVRYADHNDGKADIDAAREAARNRKSKSRGHADVTRDSRVSHAEVPISISISLSDLSSESVRDPEPTSTPREVDEAGAGSDAPSAGLPRALAEGTASADEVIADYEQAVSAVTGAIFSLDYRSGDRGRLVRLAAAYCKGKPIAEVRQWVRESVDEWVRPRVDEPDFASGFAPRGFETWLRGGRKPPKRPVSFVREPDPTTQLLTHAQLVARGML